MWKTMIRMIVLVTLMAVAVTMAAFTAADFRSAPAATAASGAYLVAEFGGSVAVFDRNDSGLTAPLQVTDIELDGLRAADREMIRAGVPISTREELMTLLEDLGT